jgi:hypothetical protein
MGVNINSATPAIHEGDSPMKSAATLTLLLLASASAYAQKPCEDLKTEIAQKLEAKSVKMYSLEIMAKDDKEGDGKVVGTCEGGTKKIVYRRSSTPAVAPAPAAEAASAPTKQ